MRQSPNGRRRVGTAVNHRQMVKLAGFASTNASIPESNGRCGHSGPVRRHARARGKGERTTERATVAERLDYPPQVGGPASDGSAAQRQEASPTVVRAADAQRAGMLRWAAARSRLLTSRRNLVNGVGRCGGDGGPRPGVIGRHRRPTENAPGAVASILRSHGQRWREGLYGFSIDRPRWGIACSPVGAVARPSAEN